MTRMLKYKIAPFLFLLIPIMSWGQNEFPKDTSFSVYSAGKKIEKDFPQALPVKEIVSSEFLSLPNQVYRIRPNRKLRMDVFSSEQRLRAETTSCYDDSWWWLAVWQ